MIIEGDRGPRLDGSVNLVKRGVHAPTTIWHICTYKSDDGRHILILRRNCRNESKTYSFTRNGTSHFMGGLLFLDSFPHVKRDGSIRWSLVDGLDSEFFNFLRAHNRLDF